MSRERVGEREREREWERERKLDYIIEGDVFIMCEETFVYL